MRNISYIYVISLHEPVSYSCFHDDSGEQPSDTEVQQLVDEVEKYALASHLLWGIWGVISVIITFSL